MPFESPEGVENMALDSQLLLEAENGRASYRIYEWKVPCVTLGMSQKPFRDLLVNCPIGYAMRPTGGRAVLHSHDITVAYALPLGSLGLEEGTKSVARAYRSAVPILLEAMIRSGQPAVLGEEVLSQRLNPTSSDCFAHVSANDIVDPGTGLKVCGCALRLTDRAVLVHASIPVRSPLIDSSKVFSKPAPLNRANLEVEALRENFHFDFGT